MKIKQISYGKTINIGNYQSVKVDFTAELDGSMSVEEVLANLKEMVRLQEVQIKGGS